MAQGAIKKPTKPQPSSTAKNTGKTKKGARIAKPKKASNADKIQRKYAAGLVAQTEKLLGQRAGHLEMIGKGRDKKEKRGGSKKFG